MDQKYQSLSTKSGREIATKLYSQKIKEKSQNLFTHENYIKRLTYKQKICLEQDQKVRFQAHKHAKGYPISHSCTCCSQ